jgi:phosphonate transport system ATP-binding protein
MLRIHHLSKHFGSVRAVDDVSIEVPEGQMLGIIGSSGAGKSTLLRLINRLWEPDSGTISFGELEVSELRGGSLLDWRSRCAMIFQQFNLVQRLDVLTNVLMGRLRHRSTLRTLFKLFPREDRELAVEMLTNVEILDQALKRCDELSGGQQQRVAIARAMMQHPRIILADEPIASLDPRSARRVMEILRQINRRESITVISSLHDLATARIYSDRVVGMSNGRIVFDGPPESLSESEIRRIYRMEDVQDQLEESVLTSKQLTER